MPWIGRKLGEELPHNDNSRPGGGRYAFLYDG